MRNFAFELLCFNSFPQHIDLISIEVLNAVDHLLLLSFLHRLVFNEILLFIQQL